MREYKLAKGWTIFIVFLCAPLLLLVSGTFLILPFIPEAAREIDPDAYWIIAPVCIAMIFVSFVGLLDALKSKFVITHEGVFFKKVFSTKTLLYPEIKGFRIQDDSIIIEPNTKSKKSIKLSTKFGKTDEVISWLGRYFPDLDELNKQREKAAILSDVAHGWRNDQRESKLNRSRKISYILNTLGILAAVWTWFRPDPYELAIISCFIIPLLAILVFRFSGGIFEIDDRKDSASPTVGWAIFPPGITLCWRALRDLNVLNYQNAIAPILALAAIIFVALLLGNNEFKIKKPNNGWAFYGFIFIVFAYSYGAVITTNGVFDNSETQVYQTKIVNKRASSGETPTYYLYLDSGGKANLPEQVTVPEALFNAFEMNEPAEVFIKNGYLNIPWFWVAKPTVNK